MAPSRLSDAELMRHEQVVADERAARGLLADTKDDGSRHHSQTSTTRVVRMVARQAAASPAAEAPPAGVVAPYRPNLYVDTSDAACPSGLDDRTHRGASGAADASLSPPSDDKYEAQLVAAQQERAASVKRLPGDLTLLEDKLREALLSVEDPSASVTAYKEQSRKALNKRQQLLTAVERKATTTGTPFRRNSTTPLRPSPVRTARIPRS